MSDYCTFRTHNVLVLLLLGNTHFSQQVTHEPWSWSIESTYMRGSSCCVLCAYLDTREFQRNRRVQCCPLCCFQGAGPQFPLHMWQIWLVLTSVYSTSQIWLCPTLPNCFYETVIFLRSAFSLSWRAARVQTWESSCLYGKYHLSLAQHKDC